MVPDRWKSIHLAEGKNESKTTVKNTLSAIKKYAILLRSVCHPCSGSHTTPHFVPSGPPSTRQQNEKSLRCLALLHASLALSDETPYFWGRRKKKVT